MDRNFIIRTISGAAIVIVVILSIWFGPASYLVLLLALNSIALYEFHKMTSPKPVRKAFVISLLQSVLVWLLMYLIILGHSDFIILVLLLPIIGISFIHLLWIPKDFSRSINSMGALLYISIPLFATAFMYMAEFGSGGQSSLILLFFFIFIWLYDTFAYLVGRAIGKHPLAPILSPKKTWEGSIGGGLVTLVAAFVINYYFQILSTFEVLIFAFLIIVFGTFGDLIESALKRNSKVKDSGNFIPGHGGVLDRFDSVLFASPFVLAYLLLLNL